MAVDALGLPLDFEITGGDVHECKIASEFIKKLPKTDFTVASKGYDSEKIRNIMGTLLFLEKVILDLTLKTQTGLYINFSFIDDAE